MTNNYRRLNGFCNFVTLNEKNEAKVTKLQITLKILFTGISVFKC